MLPTVALYHGLGLIFTQWVTTREIREFCNMTERRPPPGFNRGAPPPEVLRAATTRTAAPKHQGLVILQWIFTNAAEEGSLSHLDQDSATASRVGIASWGSVWQGLPGFASLDDCIRSGWEEKRGFGSLWRWTTTNLRLNQRRRRASWESYPVQTNTAWVWNRLLYKPHVGIESCTNYIWESNPVQNTSTKRRI